MSEANKALVRRYLDEAMNQRNLAVINELFSTDFINHSPRIDRECVKSMPNAMFVPLPELNHSQGYRRSDLVMPHITQFLQEYNGI